MKSTLTGSKQLWYVNGAINAKSNSGLEAYSFDANGKATVYNVNKYYKSLSAAKKDNALNKIGTLNTTFKTKGDNTVINFKGKLSDIPMTQKFTVKKTVTGKNDAAKLKVAGYHISRDVDDDVTQAVWLRSLNKLSKNGAALATVLLESFYEEIGPGWGDSGRGRRPGLSATGTSPTSSPKRACGIAVVLGIFHLISLWRNRR